MKCVVCEKPGTYRKDIRADATYCDEHHKVIKQAEENHQKLQNRLK